jgi:hypothetical protein
MAIAGNPLTGFLFRRAEVIMGVLRNDSIGIAQMQPDTAVERMEERSSAVYPVTRARAASVLANNDGAAIP